MKPIALLFLFLSVLMPLHAESQEDDSECLVVNIMMNAPMGYIDKDGLSGGTHWQAFVQIEKESDLCINKQIVPMARLLRNIEIGHADLAIMFKSKKRLAYSDAIAYFSSITTAVLPKKSVEIASYNDLYALNIGKTRGSFLSTRFNNDTSLSIVKLKDLGQALSMVDLGRIDAVAGGLEVMLFQLNHMGKLHKFNTEHSFYLGTREHWFHASKKSTKRKQIQSVLSAIAKLKSVGEFESIKSAGYQGFYTPKQLPL